MSKKIDIFVKFGEIYDPNAIDICTAAKCTHYNIMKRADKFPNPRPIILLYPFADECITPHDRAVLAENGLYLFDAPWETLRGLNSELKGNVMRRRLENVIETHGPYKGSDFKLTTAGAAAITLHRTGFESQAQEILDIFPWKDDFIKENFREGYHE